MMPKKPRIWNRLCANLLDLLFPPVCVGCSECLKPFQNPTPIFCDKCQKLFDDRRITNAMADRQMPIEGITQPISLVKYTPRHTNGVPERLIFHIKHHDHAPVFAYVTKELVQPVEMTLTALGISPRQCLVTYPPRRPSAVRKDGFDQAERLAQGLSHVMGAEMAYLLARTSHKATAQKKLNATKRAESANLSYALEEGGEESLSGRVILLVDDLYTTGATLQACAKLLLSAGALLVIPVTLGRTWSN